MWSKNGMPVDDLRGAGAVDDERDLDGRLLGLALQLGRPSRVDRSCPDPHGRTSWSAARSASFSAGVPTVTRRHPSTRGQREKSRTSTPRSSSRCQRSWASPSTRTSRKLAPDGYDVQRRQLRQRGEQPAALLDERGDARVHLGAELERDRRPRAASAPRGRTAAATFSSSLDHPRRARPRSRAARAASDHTFEYVRTTTSGRASSTSSSALHGANSPYASSTTSSAPAAAATSASRSIVVARLDGARRVVRAAHEHDARAARRDERVRGVGRRCAKSACRSPATTSVPVMRGDVRVQRVRRLEQRRTPARAAVGEQQRLQHLVGAVGAEDALDRLAEERAERARAARVAARSG